MIVSADADATNEGATADGNAADAVNDGSEAVALTHDTSSTSGAAAVAGDDKIPYGCARDTAEWRTPRLIVVTRVIYCQRVPLSVEGAAEWTSVAFGVAVYAYHACDGALCRADISTQTYELT